jgi:hypothetical protein
VSMMRRSSSVQTPRTRTRTRTDGRNPRPTVREPVLDLVLVLGLPDQPAVDQSVFSDFSSRSTIWV